MEQAPVLIHPKMLDRIINELALPSVPKNDEGQGRVFIDDTVPFRFTDPMNTVRPRTVGARGVDYQGLSYLRVVVVGEPFTGNPVVEEDSGWTFYAIEGDGRDGPHIQVAAPDKSNVDNTDKMVPADLEQNAKAMEIMQNMFRIQESGKQKQHQSIGSKVLHFFGLGRS